MRRVLRQLTLLCAAIVLTAVPSAGQVTEGSLERVHALVKPAIVFIEITWRGFVFDTAERVYLNNGKPFEETVSGCTGFVVDPDGYIVTAGHCVEYDSGRERLIGAAATWADEEDFYGRASAEAILAHGEENFRVEGTESRGRPDREVAVAWGIAVSGIPSGQTRPALVRGLRPYEEGDVALLSVEADGPLTALPLAPPEDIAEGAEIVAVGYPASVDLVTEKTFDPSFKDGTISAKKLRPGSQHEVYEISAALGGGMSGGPTVDTEGRVIGVNSFGIDPSIETQQFNFVSPVAFVHEIVQDKLPDFDLGPVTTAYREGINAYFAGDRETAIRKLDEVLAQVPSHEVALDYQRRAQALPVREEEGGFPLVPVLAIALGLLVLAAIAFLMVMARRRKPAPAAAAAAHTPARAEPADAPPMGTTRVRRASSAAVPMLAVRSGPAAGTSFEVKAAVVLGRENADVSLDDPEVSRRHALIRPVDGGGLEIQDLGSTNGTRVNGQKIDGPTRLSNGDVIGVGATEAEVREPRPGDTIVRR